MKICNSCNIELDIEKFEISGMGYRRNRCGRCRQASKRPRRIEKMYGITYQELLMIKESQDYRCAICSVHDYNLIKGLCVDHDHTTNKVRGYLCHTCNRAIGLLGDDVGRLQKAIDYLQLHSQ